MTKRSRAMSRRSSRSVFGGRETPSGVTSVARRSGLAQRRLEVSNTEAGQTALHPGYNARALTNDPLTLTVRALRILLRKRRNPCHVAVISFTTQPADEDAFEQPG